MLTHRQDSTPVQYQVSQQRSRKRCPCRPQTRWPCADEPAPARNASPKASFGKSGTSTWMSLFRCRGKSMRHSGCVMILWIGCRSIRMGALQLDSTLIISLRLLSPLTNSHSSLYPTINQDAPLHGPSSLWRVQRDSALALFR